MGMGTSPLVLPLRRRRRDRGGPNSRIRQLDFLESRILFSGVPGGDSGFGGVFAALAGPATIPEPVVSVAATTSKAEEVNNGAKGIGVVTFSRNGPTTDPLTVDYTVSGAANDGSNYQTLSLSVTIPTGKSSATVPVIPVENLTRSGNITVTLTAVANGSDYTLSTKDSGAVTIVDNNLAPLSIAGESLSAKITIGAAPFATTGTYQLFFAATGNQYVLMGGPSVNSTMGTFTYTRTSAVGATLDLTDGSGTSDGTLMFTKTTTAVLALEAESGPGSQNSKVTLVGPPKGSFAPATVAGLVDTHKITAGTGDLPKKGATEDIFSAASSKLVIAGTAPVPSGLDQYSYEQFGPDLGIVSFTNVDSINGFTIVLHTSATKGTYATTLDGGLGTENGSFTDVPQASTNIAPASLDGMTIDNKVSGGEAPFSNKGTSALVMNATSYSFTQTTPVAATNGTYTYERLTPGIGYVLFDDSRLGKGSYLLLFTSSTKATYVFAVAGSLGWQRGTALLTL